MNDRNDRDRNGHDRNNGMTGTMAIT